MIPLMLDVSKYKLLLFGAGKVGFRKLRPFKDCAAVTVISKNISDELSGVFTKEADVSEISDADLIKLVEEHDIIIAALPDKELNKKICAAAERCLKLFNSSDGDGNFMLPAAFSDGDFTLAVSTNGKAPAVPKFIRDRVFEDFENIGEMVALQSELRERLKKICACQEKRAEILERVLEDEEIWRALSADKEKAKDMAEIYFRDLS
ncbi:MAG: bifunctional precorrin-2 dehydrogenase/sirohydrochlorin ferrochelatase [Methanocorpusculum sp.]|nr:bifunctional precorrin-2 dehydrogenase/sirohydrochlorin ferrochelatase [Methanocorpusculum sp.]